MSDISAEDIEQIKEEKYKKTPVKKEKKPCSEERLKHLSRIREMAQAKKRESKEINEKAKAIDLLKKNEKKNIIISKAKEFDEIVNKNKVKEVEEEEEEKPLKKEKKKKIKKIVYESESSESEEEIIIRKKKPSKKNDNVDDDNYNVLLHKTSEEKLKEKYNEERIKHLLHSTMPLRYGW